MSNHSIIDSLIEEKNELEVRLGSLQVHYSTLSKTSIPYVEIFLMKCQIDAMQEYLNVLRSRISVLQDYTKNQVE